MHKQSAGILLYRKINTGLQVFLVHPGGPFFKNKDEAAWSIPKGEFEAGEDPLYAARREFLEETGHPVPEGDFIELSPVRLKSGKTVYAWALAGDIDHHNINSNHFEMEWPPKSGKIVSFAEVDRADWFDVAIAKTKINPAQAKFLEELEDLLK